MYSLLRALVLPLAVLSSLLLLVECGSDKGSNPPDPIIKYTMVPADFPTIQEAIDSASDFDTIIVSDGHYYERISFLGKSLTLASRFLLDNDTNHITNTIIDGDTAVLGVSDTGSVVILTGESTLCGITITGGIGNDSNFGRVGGGIFCQGSPTIRNCNIENNTAKTGGGLYILKNSISISDCAFRGNIADGGGAIASMMSTIECQGCFFDGNMATAFGGSAYTFSTLIHFTRCHFTSNTADQGAGLYLLISEGHVTDCLFQRNVALTKAPAIIADEPLYIRGSTITHNRISSGIGQVIQSGTTEIKQTIISSNENCSAILGNTVTTSCSNIFGNSEGDWTDNIVDQLGTDGNVSLDPMFCDTTASDFRISKDSPCAPSNNDCGVKIGALDVGCDK